MGLPLMSLTSSIQAAISVAFGALGDLVQQVSIRSRTGSGFDYSNLQASSFGPPRIVRAFIEEGRADNLTAGSRDDVSGLRFVKRVTLEGRVHPDDEIDIGDGFRPFRIREVSDFAAVIDVDA